MDFCAALHFDMRLSSLRRPEYSMQPNIVIADDHSMIRKGMKLLLKSQLGYKNVAEVSSCNELMNLLKNDNYTHLILDIIFADGTALEIAPAIRKLYPDIRIMIFSMQLSEVYSEAFKQYNIHYYLNKSLSEERSMQYISRFLNDQPASRGDEDNLHQKNPFSELAPRELEILHYLLNGHSTNNIASTLNLSTSTISTVKKRIMEKTDTSNITQLLELALLYNINF